MEPELEKLLEKIKPNSRVTRAEAMYLKEVNKMRLEGDPFYLVLLNKYFDKKLCG